MKGIHLHLSSLQQRQWVGWPFPTLSHLGWMSWKCTGALLSVRARHSLSPLHCGMASARSPGVCACSGPPWALRKIWESVGVGGEAEPWIYGLFAFSKWLDNEMTQVGSQELFQRASRNEKAGYTPKVLKRYFERCQCSSSNTHGGPGWPIRKGTVGGRG